LTVDAHVHLWRLSRGDNAALSPAMTAIYRDREPADLKPLIDAAGVERVVVVQAAETLAETLFTVGLARKHAWIAGVVAWIELASPSVEEEVAALVAIPTVKGVRPVRDDNKSIAWMLDSRLEQGFQALQDHGLSLDILVQNWRNPPRDIARETLAGTRDRARSLRQARRRRRPFRPMGAPCRRARVARARRLQALRIVELRRARSGPRGRGSLCEPSSHSIRSEQGDVGERLATPGLGVGLCDMEAHI
jgi:hypothetical protein